MGHPAGKKGERNPVEEIAKIAFELTGVQLSERHFHMISSRLHRRIQSLGLRNVEDYLDYLDAHLESEREFLIGALTTHHTYFFREFTHFEFLAQKGLDHAIAQARRRGDRTIRVWSAACSRGQEVYSLAMWLLPLLQAKAPELKLDILGTDVDPQSISVAQNAVYPWNDVKEIPLQYLNSYWTRGKGDIANFAKVTKVCRSHCRFETQNLFNPSFSKQESTFDIIFCRNVFIYFKPEQVAALTKTLLNRCAPEGMVFLGLSESLHGLGLPVKSVGPSIYVKPEHSWVAPAATPAEASPASPARQAKVSSPVPTLPNKIRVLVVDDSSTIHTLMKRVFTPDQGFEIVGSAMNGIEAAAKLKACKPDAVTLDIHMPEQDGVSYLINNFGPSHPPVVMVTSVSRADSEFAIKALKFGASDYVEKPDMRNFETKADEIRTKVRCAVYSKGAPGDSSHRVAMDKAFESTRTIDKPDEKLRILAMQPSDRIRIGEMIKAWSAQKAQPPLVLVADADAQGEEILRGELERSLGRKLKLSPDFVNGRLTAGEIYLVFRSGETGRTLAKMIGARKCSVLVLGELSKALCEQLAGLKSNAVQFILEDLGGRNSKHHLAGLAHDHSPVSGFGYFSDRYLCQKAS